MVAGDIERTEANSPTTPIPRSNDSGPPSLGRQSSIYSLTLDEFQSTMCEGGKNFGSMNMDEFLNSIWTAEENHHHPQNDAVASTVAQTLAIGNPQLAPAVSGIARQPSLSRQGSLTLPTPLCRKTVEEVWSEIQRGGHRSGRGQNHSSEPGAGPAQQRQQTFGEMTLEDFLIKAGVVRDSGPGAPPSVEEAVVRHQQQAAAAPAQYGIYQNGNSPQVGHPTYGPAPVPVMTAPGGFPALPQNGGGPGGGEPSAYGAAGPGGSKRSNGYAPVGPAPGVCYGGPGVGNGGGYGPGMGMASPVSPLGPEGLVDGPGGQYGMDVGGLRARKRTLDGPVEKVVERRQRRMIKNRESAARSRARKQAYTVELEAELNQLREENGQLKETVAELERQRCQQQLAEEPRNVARSSAQKRQDRLRSKSCPL